MNDELYELRINGMSEESAKAFTLAAPEVRELVRYDKIYDYEDGTDRMMRSKTGEYVRYNQAAEVITAERQAAIDARNLLQYEKDQQWRERAEAAEAKLAQIKAQVPVAVVRFDRSDGNENEMPKVVSCNWLPDGDYLLYAARTALNPSEPQS